MDYVVLDCLILYSLVEFWQVFGAKSDLRLSSIEEVISFIEYMGGLSTCIAYTIYTR